MLLDYYYEWRLQSSRSELVSFFIFFQKTLPSLKICGGRVEVYYHQSKSRKEVIISSQISVNSVISNLIFFLLFHFVFTNWSSTKLCIHFSIFNINSTQQDKKSLNCTVTNVHTYKLQPNATQNVQNSYKTQYCTASYRVVSTIKSWSLFTVCMKLLSALPYCTVHIHEMRNLHIKDACNVKKCKSSPNNPID